MNFLTSPASFFGQLYLQRGLVRQLFLREMSLRFKGSVLGRAWIVVQPLILLALYTYVFGFVFQAKWKALGQDSGAKGVSYSLLLFVSLIVFNVIGETLQKAPNIVISNPNFVKKVVFPLEILSVVSVLTSMFQFFVSMILFVAAYLLLEGLPPQQFAFMIMITVNLFLFALGLSWILSALAVFVRDVVNLVPTVTTLLMFVTPVFYPVDAVPEKFRWIVALNPIAYLVESARMTLDGGWSPNWVTYSGSLVFSIFIAWFGFMFFKWVKPTFADVI